MIELYAGLLIVLALVLATLPFFRPRTGERVDRAATVRALYRGRLKELDAELASGQLSGDTRAEVEQELGAALLEDFADTNTDTNTSTEVSPDGEVQGVPASNHPISPWGWVLVAILLPLASITIYLSLGDPGAAEIRGAEVVLQLGGEGHDGVLNEWRDRLSARVSSKPEDSQSWYLLGHAELKLSNYQRAAEAFAVAQAFHGNDPNIDIYWLQARYLAAGGQVDQGTSEIAGRILVSAPSQPMVLEILAIDAFRKGNYQEAVSHLNQALTNPLAPAQRAVLTAGFEQARAQLGDLKPSVDITIDAQGQIPDGAILFVIARPLGGGMPFAVVRRPAVELPLTVRLDDAVSMNPAVGLSQAGQVEIVVRLSRSGTAMAEAGDWEWRSHTVELGALEAPLELVAQLLPPG